MKSILMNMSRSCEYIPSSSPAVASFGVKFCCFSDQAENFITDDHHGVREIDRFEFLRWNGNEVMAYWTLRSKPEVFGAENDRYPVISGQVDQSIHHFCGTDHRLACAAERDVVPTT